MIAWVGFAAGLVVGCSLTLYAIVFVCDPRSCGDNG